jgi:phosphatidylglycerol:prolipoprotein diacylglycerol transferase
VFPQLFTLGPLTFYTYGALLALAFLAGLYVATARARRLGLESARVLDLGILVIVAAIVGAKLLLLLVEWPSVTKDPGEIWSVLRAGGVFYGGLVTAVAAAFWFLRRHHLPLWTVCDAFAPGIALGHVIGRLGCLMAGCCYGKPTSLPWGITFHDPIAASHSGTPLDIALHPTQLYESGAEALILAVLLLTERTRNTQGPGGERITVLGRQYPGRTFWLYLALYAVSRFAIEFFRGDDRGAVLSFSTSQAISLVIFPLSLVMLALLARRAAPNPDHGRIARARG